VEQVLGALVAALLAGHPPHDRQPVRLRGHLGEVLGDQDARRARLDVLERAARLRPRLGSKVSIWLGLPFIQSTMHALAAGEPFAVVGVGAAFARASPSMVEEELAQVEQRP